jgi:hypothetical protein
LLAFFLTPLGSTQVSAQVYPDEVEVFVASPPISATVATCCFADTGEYLSLSDFVVFNSGSAASRVQINVVQGGVIGGTVLVATVPSTGPFQMHLNTALVLNPGEGLTFFSDGLSPTFVFISGYKVPIPCQACF